MVIDEIDPRFVIGESTIRGAGHGLFARVALGIGDRLEVIGVFVQPNSIADRCTYYADQHKFRVGDYLLIPLGYGGMVNHSSNPNMEKVIDGGSLYLQVVRPVEKGEELFFRYSDYAQERFGLNGQ